MRANSCPPWNAWLGPRALVSSRTKARASGTDNPSVCLADTGRLVGAANELFLREGCLVTRGVAANYPPPSQRRPFDCGRLMRWG